MCNTNWAGNYAYRAARLHHPHTVEALRKLVARADKLKVLGTRHSFNDIADTDGDLVSLAHLNRVLALDMDATHPSVTIEAGVTYGQLAHHLHAGGYALPNLASLPHISVAGACATATHGSGDDNGILATSVRAVELISADGEVKRFSREHEEFRGAVVALGGLGAMTELTLDIVPAFDARQEVYQDLPLTEFAEHFDAIMSSAYSVSLFTDWRTSGFNQLWLKQRGAATIDPESFGATPARQRLHPIAGISAENCTEQLGIPGPWHERLPHFRMDFMPSAGEELQSEYFVPRERAIAALRAIDAMSERIAPHLQISEVRSIAADDLWMSPCHRQPCIAIHFTWRKDWPAVRALLPVIEAQLSPFDARPHWGKLFTIFPAQLQPLYPKLEDFRNLLRKYDSRGKFRNAFLDRYVFG
ncbi:MAG TPA: FAD-binding protein [Tepidisphaeraceae bacterium]|nr:FAD-binding protein [Tepidisphaeraceae bacterium]